MKSEIEAAMEAARAGSEILMNYWQKLGQADADLKGRNDWVSTADRESEDAMRRILGGHFPGDAFVCEESGLTGGVEGTEQREWVIDPLDGTSNYLRHFPFWCTSIGLRSKGELLAGVIYRPLDDEWFIAEAGSGAFRNGERMQVSSQPGLEGAFLATGFPFRAQRHLTTYTAIFKDVIATAKGVRRAGSAALDLAYTAAGIFDGFFELNLAPWDIAAGALLVLEAGGTVSDFSGGDRFWTRGNIVGASAGVHADLLALIERHTSEDVLDH